MGPKELVLSAMEGQAMQFLKSQLIRLQQQLGDLSVTQKMLAIALVIIMAMTLVWWGNYASKPEMVALLEQPLKGEEASVITSRLKAQGISYRIENEKIMVPAEARWAAMGDLSYNRLLPQDTSSVFKEYLDNSGPFDSAARVAMRLTEIKQVTLARIIRQWPRVAGAAVVLDTTRQRGFDKLDPTAAVSITMLPNSPADNKIVDAAADMVAGFVAGMPRSKVRVVIDGKPYAVRDRDDSLPADSDERLAAVQKAERHYTEKLADTFRFAEGVVVTVNVKQNLERTVTKTHTVDPKNFISKPVSSKTTTDNNRSNSKASAEPGVITNGAMAVPDNAASEGTSNDSEKTEEEFRVDHGTTDKDSVNPGGDLAVTAASVLIPRSFFIRSYKQTTNSDKDPDATVLDTYISAETKRLKPAALNALGLAASDAVHVDAYTDLMPVMAAASPQAAGATVSLVVSDHVKEIALGALALVSLFMVSNMVKKSAPAPVVAPPPVAVEPPPKLGEPEVAVGEASNGGPPLDGMELDENAVKSQQMLTQVSQLVDEDPDAAAGLVKRWLNRA